MRSSRFAAPEGRRARAPDPARVAWIAGRGYAHRGLHGPGVPENSPAAFEAAIARGLGIECDVQRSADGEAMVFHDWTLERLTAAEGPVAGRTAAELEAIALRGSSERIPTLAHALARVAGRAPLLIEIKSRRNLPVAGLCAAVRRALDGYRGDHAVMSFDPRVPRWFAAAAPHTVRGLVVTRQGERPLLGGVRRRVALWLARPDFLACDIRDLPCAFAAAQRARGLPIVTWTVHSPELAARAARHADAPVAEGAGIG